MKVIKRACRLLYINYVLIKYRLDEFVLDTRLFSIFQFFSNKRHLPRGQRIREACEELGPIFVKFGQLLSTRLDLLPDDIAKELVKLQDKVPPFCSQQATEIIETTLGGSVTSIFDKFDPIPLASASIAQVHAATLKNHQDVVVKVLRPDVDKQITQDIELLQILAKFVHRCWGSAKRFRPLELVNEFKKSIFDELDLLREAANASQLRRNFLDSSLLYVPEIYWPLTKKNVLVMERIYGIPVSDIAQLKKYNINLKRLAERGVEIFFTQVFRDCFFHADMHPGNVWVSPNESQNPKYMALDFGIMGTLGPNDQRYLAENFLAFFKRDYRRVAELHVESGWVPPHTRIDEFESAIRCVCEPIFERPLKDISFGKTLLRLFQTARRFDMEIQPQLLLLQKTLISVEGLGRQLYPDLDLWNTAKPFLETWMKNRIGTKALFRKVKDHAPYWIEKLPDLPNIFYKALSQTVEQKAFELNNHNKKNNNRNTLLGILFGLVLGSVFGGFLVLSFI